MKIKPGHSRQLPAQDEWQIEQLLIAEYRTAEISDMCYSYPMNDGQLLIEYAIGFFEHAERIKFFRKAYKKNGQWYLSGDFRKMNETDRTDIAEIIKGYIE